MDFPSERSFRPLLIEPKAALRPYPIAGQRVGRWNSRGWVANVSWSNAYILTCRAIWYDKGCLSAKLAIDKNIFPPDELGRVVGIETLRHWLTEKDWYTWKDEQDAKFESNLDDELIGRKVLLIKEQLGQAREIRNKAFLYLTETEFDSSASANQAFFKASADERNLVGIEQVIEKLSKMQTPEIKARMKELAERAEATDVIDVAEVDNTESLD